MGDIHDSIADASHTLVFQVGPIRHVVPEIAERSPATHCAVEGFHMVLLDCEDAFLLTVLEDFEYHPAVSHVPDRTPCHDGS
jgi:hypothetical protein